MSTLKKLDKVWFIDERFAHFAPVIIKIFTDYLSDKKLTIKGLNIKSVIAMIDKSLRPNKLDNLVFKELINSLRLIFKNDKDEEVRGKIIEALVNAINPENNNELNMKILDVLDEICPEIDLNNQEFTLINTFIDIGR